MCKFSICTNICLLICSFDMKCVGFPPFVSFVYSFGCLNCLYHPRSTLPFIFGSRNTKNVRHIILFIDSMKIRLLPPSNMRGKYHNHYTLFLLSVCVVIVALEFVSLACSLVSRHSLVHVMYALVIFLRAQYS